MPLGASKILSVFSQGHRATEAGLSGTGTRCRGPPGGCRLWRWRHGDASDEPVAAEPTPEPAPEPAPSDEPTDPEPELTESAPGSQALPITATVGDGWTATTVGQVIKPAIALDSTGSPGIAWLFEAFEGGFVKFAAASEGWQEETIEEGYFYGPLDVTFDPQDAPNIVWHDHEDVEITPNTGNLRHAVRIDSEWDRGPARDPGHDGWDSTIAIGTDGPVHAAGIDPSQFNSFHRSSSTATGTRTSLSSSRRTRVAGPFGTPHSTARNGRSKTSPRSKTS